MRPPSIPEIKARLRDEVFARRDALDPVWRTEASLAMAERAAAIPELRDREPVSGFWPIRSEIDVKILMEALHARGQTLDMSGVWPRAWPKRLPVVHGRRLPAALDPLP